MGLRLLIERVLDHGGKDSRGMSHADSIDAGRHQPLDEVVHRQIRGGGGEDLLAPRGSSSNQFHQDSGLSSAGRTMHQHQVVGALRLLQRGLLLRIQPVLDSRRFARPRL